MLKLMWWHKYKDSDSSYQTEALPAATFSTHREALLNPCWLGGYVCRWMRALHHYHLRPLQTPFKCSGHLLFLKIITAGEDRASQCLICELLCDANKMFSHITKRIMSGWRRCLTLLKAYKHAHSFCSFLPLKEIGPFSSCMRNTECLQALTVR